MAALDVDGQARIVPNGDGFDATPAIAHFYEPGAVVVGHEALKAAALEPERVVRDAAAHLGDSAWGPTLHGQRWTAQEVVGVLLRKLREDASELRGADLRQAVIAVPTRFDSAQRAAVREAAAIGGLEVLSIANHAYVAALGAGLNHGKDGRHLLVELGASGLESTILEKRGTRLDIVATSSDPELVPEAFADRVRYHLLQLLQADLGIDPTGDAVLAQQILDASRFALETLVHRPFVAIRLGRGRATRQVRLERRTFDVLTHHLVAKVLVGINHVLKRTANADDELREVTLVGAIARLPLVVEVLRRRFGRRLVQPHAAHLAGARGTALAAALKHDPDHPGLAAARAARRRHPTGPRTGTTGSSEAAPVRRRQPSPTSPHAAVLGLADGGHLGEIIDKTDRSLGMIALDRQRRERVVELIPAGSTIPVEVTRNFAYARANMTGVRVEVTEGVGTRRQDVEVIGVVELRGLPPRPPGTPIEVTYRYGDDQILRVAVRDVETGTIRDVRIRYRGGLGTVEVERARNRANRIQIDGGSSADRPAPRAPTGASADGEVPAPGPADPLR